MNHVAYNVETGEVIITNHSSHLKREVKNAMTLNKKYNYPTGKWIFAHGSDAGAKLEAKIYARTTQLS